MDSLEGVTTLGDVHLGKVFRTGVPLHRLGEREREVLQDFEVSIGMCLNPLHVQVGDIFDQMCVSETIVLKAANIYKYYAECYPNRKFALYRGNHDASKDANIKSSFDVLAELLAHVPNVYVFKDEVGILQVGSKTYGFLPWHPFKTSEQLAFDLIGATKTASGLIRLDAVFCHCDIESFGNKFDNLIPTRILSQITDTVVTGHVHTPDEYDVDGVHVIVTGSMQPYSHSEDLKGVLYVSLTLEQFHKTDPETLKNMNVRILLQPGEVLPAAPDCLSFIGKTVPVLDDEEDDSEPEVGFDTFNMNQLFHDVLKERQVGGEVAAKIEAKYKELRIG